MKRTAGALITLSIIAYAVWIVASNNPTSAFAQATANADRIVIHASGLDESLDESRTIFLEIVDPQMIAEFNANFEFQRSLPGGSSACQGFPGIDWYRNGQRVVYTGMQHKTRIRWSRYEYDLPLTEESATRLEKYLNLHGVPLNGLAETGQLDESVEREYEQVIQEIKS